MADVTGGAPAPADSPAVSDEVIQTPNPVTTEREPLPEKKDQAKDKPDSDKDSPKKSGSIKDALQRAKEKIEAEGKDKPTDTPKPAETKGADKADPEGKDKAKDAAKPDADDKTKQAQADKPADPAKTADAEAAKQQQKTPATQTDAPGRFSNEAKAAWANTPDVVRSEMIRALSENEKGIEKYRTSHEEYEAVRPFADMAKQGGTDLKTALTAYVGIENAWRENPALGFVNVCQNMGVDPVKQAEAIMQALTGAKNLPQGDTPEIAGLKQQIAALQQQVGQVGGTLKERDALAHVEAFAKDHPRLDELSEHISELIGRGFALQDAYEWADARYPAASTAPAQKETPAPAPAEPAKEDLTAQTRAGSRSISGSPTPGSNPSERKPSSSIKDAIRRAREQVT